jgi:hypothetical protein
MMKPTKSRFRVRNEVIIKFEAAPDSSRVPVKVAKDRPLRYKQ